MLSLSLLQCSTSFRLIFFFFISSGRLLPSLSSFFSGNGGLLEGKREGAQIQLPEKCLNPSGAQRAQLRAAREREIKKKKRKRREKKGLALILQFVRCWFERDIHHRARGEREMKKIYNSSFFPSLLFLS